MRLRQKPGRPRKEGTGSITPDKTSDGDRGRDLGRRAMVYEAVDSLLPRLLDLRAVAAYLGVSSWTVRDLETNGTLRRVSIPSGAGRELRKLLFDRQDLDRLVETWKAS